MSTGRCAACNGERPCPWCGRGEQSPADWELELDAARAELLAARLTIGEAWFSGGATTATAAARKCTALEALIAAGKAEHEAVEAARRLLRAHEQAPGAMTPDTVIHLVSMLLEAACPT